jgi:hypothetical protein
MKKTFVALSLLLSAFVLPCSAAHAAEAPAMPSLCSMTVGTPEAQWTLSPGCHQQADCISVENCWTFCPEALSVSCTPNGCQYVLPGGGGTTGGGACPQQRDCLDDTHCVYGSLQGTCSPVTYTCTC